MESLSLQHPGDAGSGTLRRMIVVVARVQMKHRVNSLFLIEGLNFLYVLPSTPQDRTPGLALSGPRKKKMQFGQRFGLWKKMYSFMF